MKWFLNLTTRAKIIFSFGLMFILLAVITCVAIADIWSIRDSLRGVVLHDYPQVFDLMEARANLNRVRAQLLEMMLTRDKAKQLTLEQDIKERVADTDKKIKDLLQLYKDENDQRSLAKIEEMSTIQDAYRTGRDEQISMIYRGKIEEARQLGIGIQEERYGKLRNIALELEKLETSHAQQRVDQSGRQATAALIIFLVVGSSAFLFCLVMGNAMNQGIATPLTEITGIAERVAAGDLEVTIPAVGRVDEVGILAQVFRRMVENISGMANLTKRIAEGDLSTKVAPQSERDVMGNALAAMVENLRTQTLAIREGINVLASAAGEILASSTQIASSAAETASAVNETTVTVEEVKQTTQLSTQKARHVADSAQRSLQVSQQGKKAAEDTIQGMSRIREQMETVAESIVSLSDQSQAIGEIIATVNDLAEQSNLLAVNAAIEAAKAGEHGKGFAVVAQEVRSLAEQSKQATSQVRMILNDIQKATNAAVMATEQGSKAVEAGEKQAGDAGDAIRVLADSIAESASASTQIAASSQQQMAGMDQVALAMDNIKEASNLSVGSSQQAEQSAQNLNELGQKLKRLVEQFKL
jgi:methyl-accepting chemotaxis protein